MSGLLIPLRDACGRNPGQVLLIVIIALAAGCGIGYLILGPALFG